MKHTVCCVSLAIFNLVCASVWAAAPTTDATVHPAPVDQHQLLQNKAEQIVKKCVAKAMLIRDERICESKKTAITACLAEEVKTKDIDKAQQVCERNYIL
ncbi:MAG: hypothetical protein RI902_873 [Pseudomonadota bacterium]|jgi:hypothetical protein